jgi:ceramide glucosyltransferase
MDIVLYILSFLAIVQGVISLKDGRRNLKYALSYSKPGVSEQTVVVFCPVKGVDAELEANIDSLLRQSYSAYRVVFIVDSETDPAFPILSARLEKTAGGGEIRVAGQAENCGQKVHNLIHGVASAGEESDILVFCDADARFRSDWLNTLVAPLEDTTVGAATGYRWYLASGSSLPSLIRSAWNTTVVGFLGPHSRNFVWGGSTAIRRATFDSAQVLKHWQGALSDDYALTTAVRRAGLRIVYVPGCLVASYDRCSWRQLMEFTTRQIRITRVYAPRMWTLGLVTYTLFNTTFLWLTFRMWGEWMFFLPWALIYGLSIVRADLRLQAAANVLKDRSLARHRWFYRLSPPLTALLYEWNFLRTIIGRRLVWKGIRYTLVSASETRVER